MTGFVFRIFQEELYIAAAGREIRMENKGKKQNGLGGGGGDHKGRRLGFCSSRSLIFERFWVREKKGLGWGEEFCGGVW
jgi:hypothetical protein